MSKLTYWTCVIKNIFVIALLIAAVFISLKLAVFYMPFLIAFIISLIIEPIIKWLMQKFNLSRKLSSIIVLFVTFGMIAGILTLGITTIISESNDILENLNFYYEKSYDYIQNFASKIDLEKFNISDELVSLLEDNGVSIINKLLNYVQNFLTKIISGITMIPTIAIYFVVAILSLYFICTDKIYILDEFEHHLPKKWAKEIIIHLRELTKTLGGYLKAQIILILISFVICLIGLYIFYFIGLNVEFPLIMAIVIAFVDALPILGSGTVMVPWGIVLALNGDISLAISVIVLWILMSIVRQFVEPKIVSRKYWNSSYFYNYSYVYWF